MVSDVSLPGALASAAPPTSDDVIRFFPLQIWSRSHLEAAAAAVPNLRQHLAARYPALFRSLWKIHVLGPAMPPKLPGNFLVEQVAQCAEQTDRVVQQVWKRDMSCLGK